MKKLIFSLVFPLTFISYFLFDKWWYVLIIDAFDVNMFGFPLINSSPAMGASMEFEYYVLETIINISCFFIFWLAVVSIINRFIKPIFISNLIGKTCLILLGLYLIAFTYYSIEFNARFAFKRDCQIEIMDTGFEWFWQYPPTPDLNKYHPEKKE